MSIDLSKLEPAPWGYCYDGSSDWSVGVEADPQEGLVASVHGRDDEWARTNAAFLVLARNAFDVMMRRPEWFLPPKVKLQHQGGDWYVDIPERRICVPAFTDPFTALVEADAWYKANTICQEVGNDGCRVLFERWDGNTNTTDADFCCLARNAFDVLQHLPIDIVHVVAFMYAGRKATHMQKSAFVDWMIAQDFKDLFSALVACEPWWQANVEVKS